MSIYQNLKTLTDWGPVRKIGDPEKGGALSNDDVRKLPKEERQKISEELLMKFVEADKRYRDELEHVKTVRENVKRIAKEVKDGIYDIGKIRQIDYGPNCTSTVCSIYKNAGGRTTKDANVNNIFYPAGSDTIFIPGTHQFKSNDELLGFKDVGINYIGPVDVVQDRDHYSGHTMMVIGNDLFYNPGGYNEFKYAKNNYKNNDRYSSKFIYIGNSEKYKKEKDDIERELNKYSFIDPIEVPKQINIDNQKDKILTPMQHKSYIINNALEGTIGERILNRGKL